MKLYCWVILSLAHLNVALVNEDDIVREEVMVVLGNFSVSNKHDFIDAHIDYLAVSYPEIEVVRIYRNLIPYNFIAYQAWLTEPAYNAVKSDPRVKLVEPIMLFQDASIVSYVPYDDEKVGRIHLPENSKCVYEYTNYDKFVDKSANVSNGHDVDVYVLDTGIDLSRSSLGDRARHGVDTVVADRRENGTDTNGHGTYVAGVIGTLAPSANIISVRVLDTEGVGGSNEIIAGLDYVAGEMMQSRSKLARTVINLSFSGPKSEVVNSALNFLSRRAVVVGAVGDDDEYSCETTPASASGVVAVGAAGRRSLLPIRDSNFGECVKVLAPGEHIPSPFRRQISAAEKDVTSSPTSSGSTDENATGHVESSQAVQEEVVVEYRSGSSVAAAVVSGLAAITIAQIMDSAEERDTELVSFVQRYSATIVSAALRMPEERDARTPHRLPYSGYDLCQASRTPSPIPLVRAMFRDEITRKIAAKSLSGIKKVVEAMGGRDKDKTSKTIGDSSSAGAGAGGGDYEQLTRRGSDEGPKMRRTRVVGPNAPKTAATTDSTASEASSPVEGNVAGERREERSAIHSADVSPKMPPVEVSSKRRRSQAEIIEEAKRLKKLKK